jgi:hypothetical protein
LDDIKSTVNVTEYTTVTKISHFKIGMRLAIQYKVSISLFLSKFPYSCIDGLITNFDVSLFYLFCIILFHLDIDFASEKCTYNLKYCKNIYLYFITAIILL